MTTFSRDQDVVLYTLDPLPLADTDALRAALLDPHARWYAERRLRALALVGLVADGKFNPVLHPRGKDGQFIDKFGFVRWLIDGKWYRGRVMSIDEDGNVHVRPDNRKSLLYPKGVTTEQDTLGGITDASFPQPTKTLYSLPKPKASFDLPDPTVPAGSNIDWKKTSGQLGSNPGAMFQATTGQEGKTGLELSTIYQIAHDTDLVEGKPGTASDVLKAKPAYEDMVGIYQDKQGNRQVAFASSYADQWLDVAGEPITDLPDNQPILVTFAGTVNNVAKAADLYAALTPNSVEPGDKFYVKKAKSQDHARTEALAAYLYEKTGLAVPEVNLNGDQTELSSRIVKGESMSLTDALKDPALASEIRSGMVVDAWLANWDVIGLGFDNLTVFDGVPYRLDTGGALSYRAMGAPKGKAFGNDVGELETFMNPNMNLQAAQVFASETSNITQAELHAGAEKVASISPNEIRNAVEEMDVDPSVADKLIARRKFIIDKFGAIDPYSPLLPPVEIDTHVPPPTPADVAAAETPAVATYDDKLVADHEFVTWWVGGIGKGEAANTVATSRVIEQMQTDDLFAADDQLWRVTEMDSLLNTVQVTGVDVASGEERKFGFVALDNFSLVPDSELGDYRDHVDKLWSVSSAYDLNSNPQHPDQPLTFASVYADGEWMGEDQVKVGGDPIYPAYSSSEFGNYLPSASLKHPTGDPGKPAYIFDQTDGQLYRVDSVVDPAADNTPGDYNLQLTNMENGTKLSLGMSSPYFVHSWRKVHNAYTARVVEQMVANQGATKQDDKEADTNIWQVHTPGGDHPAAWDDPDFISLINEEPPPKPPPEIAMAKADAAKAQAETPEVLPASPAAVSVDGVNAELQPADEPVSLYELTHGNASPEDLVGKTVVLTRESTMTKDGHDMTLTAYSQLGLWHVESFEKGKKPQYGPSNADSLILKSANGLTRRLSMTPDLYVTEAFGHKDTLITPVNFDLGAPMPPLTLKKNGDIVSQGTVVGKWDSHGGGYGWNKWKEYTLHIDPAYSVTGSKVSMSSNKQSTVRAMIAPLVIPPAPHPSKPKQSLPHVEAFEQKVKTHAPAVSSPVVPAAISLAPVNNAGVTGPPEALLADGMPVQIGMKVTSVKDGLTGVVVGFLKGSTHKPGNIKIRRDDNNKFTFRHATTFNLTTPAATPAHPNAGMPLMDGTIPEVGMKVATIHGTKSVSGTITEVVPDKKWIKIQPDAMWVQASKATPTPDFTSPETVAPDLPAPTAAGVLEKPDIPKSVADAKVATKAKAAKSKAPNVPYPGPDGAVVDHDTAAQTKWTADGYKLTKDGYALRLGMWVRDSKGNQRIVAEIPSKYATNPSSIRVVDPATGELSRRVSSALVVDHMAELTNTNGDDLPKIAGIVTVKHQGTSAPYYGNDGAVVYRTVDQMWDSKQQRYKPVDVYVVIDGDKVIRPGFGSFQSKTFFAQIGHDQKPWIKVATIDHTSDLSAAYKPAQQYSYSGKGNVGTTWEISTDASAQPDAVLTKKAKADADAEAAKASASGIIPAKTPVSSAIQPLSPPLIPANVAATAGPQPPPIPDTPAQLNHVPKMLEGTAAKSPLQAVVEAVKEKDSTGPDSGLHYAVGDSDYIEDMQVRAQIAKDAKGDEFVEVHFRLQEEKSDALSDKLVVMGNVKLGGWVKGNTGSKVKVTDLVEGDHIAVRLSSTTHALKPDENAAQPNATVIGPGVLIGTTPSGSTEYPTYRVPVSFKDGTFGEVDIQLREAPTFYTFEYDPMKPVQSSGGHETLTAAAQQAGWSEETPYMAFDGVVNKTNVDATGAKLLTTGPYASSHWGTRLQRNLDDGTQIHLNIASSKNGGLTQSSSPKSPRRSELNGEIEIRIPIEGHANPNAINDALSEAMSAVGIPVEAQGAATDAQLAKLAIGKIDKTYSPQYHHRERSDATGFAGDQATTAVLADLDKVVEGKLGRKTTLHDIRLHVFDDGRLQVMVSPEVAHAITERQKIGYYKHGTSYGDNLVETLSSPLNGYMGASDRFSAGVLTYNGSAPTDIDNGAGDRIYLTSYHDVSLYGTSGVILNPDAVNMSAELYANNHDAWGNRSTLNGFWNGAHHETMYKHRIPPEMIAYVIAPGNKRDAVIKKLHARGVTQIGGRPIEDIIVDHVPKISDDGVHPSPDFLKLGVENLGVVVPLDELQNVGQTVLPVGGTPAPAAAGPTP